MYNTQEVQRIIQLGLHLHQRLQNEMLTDQKMEQHTRVQSMLKEARMLVLTKPATYQDCIKFLDQINEAVSAPTVTSKNSLALMN